MCNYRVAGLSDDATIAELAALAFEQSSRPQTVLMLYNLGTMFLMTQRPISAEKWLRAALRYDPELVVAHQNLASILELDGNKAEAQYHRDQAYRRQNVFIDAVVAPTVLVLCAAATGNVPIDFLLPVAAITRIKWIMDYAVLEQSDHFPTYDLVFNAIGDQDVTARSSAVVTVLGPAAMQVLRAIGQRLNLDYCGVDFSLLEDGRILLFETNATMLAHPEQFHTTLHYKNCYVQRILDAFACMMPRRIDASNCVGQ
jgi:hypothetical protein